MQYILYNTHTIHSICQQIRAIAAEQGLLDQSGNAALSFCELVRQFSVMGYALNKVSQPPPTNVV
jgi:hypothetical protein